MAKAKLSVTLDDDVITMVDGIRGLAARSTIINDLLKKKLAEERNGNGC